MKAVFGQSRPPKSSSFFISARSSSAKSVQLSIRSLQSIESRYIRSPSSNSCSKLISQKAGSLHSSKFLSTIAPLNVLQTVIEGRKTYGLMSQISYELLSRQCTEIDSLNQGKNTQAQSCAQINTARKMLAQQDKQPPMSVPCQFQPLKKKLIGCESQSYYFRNGILAVTPSFVSPTLDYELIASVAQFRANATLFRRPSAICLGIFLSGYLFISDYEIYYKFIKISF